MGKTQAITKISKNFDKLIKRAIVVKFEKAAEEVQEVIIAEYDKELVDVVSNRKSKTNPNLYRDEFIERLLEFSYIEDSGNIISLICPDMETFDFSGRLKVIQTIMEGLSGIYVEVSDEDYIKVFGKRPLNQEPLDEYVPAKEKVYIVRYNAKIRRAEKELRKRFVRYPFSNSAPIRILDKGDVYIEDNISRWIDESIEEANSVFTTNYKGASL